MVPEFLDPLVEAPERGHFELSCGQVLRQGLRELWERSPLLAELRDFDLLGGKCGGCEYKATCGGCRARAFAATGEWLAPDPMCPYAPPAR